MHTQNAIVSLSAGTCALGGRGGAAATVTGAGVWGDAATARTGAGVWGDAPIVTTGAGVWGGRFNRDNRCRCAEGTLQS